MYPCVTVNLVQRHGVTVVFLFRSPPYNNHGVFYQRCRMEEPGQGLCRRKERRQKNKNIYRGEILVSSKVLRSHTLLPCEGTRRDHVRFG